MANKISFQQTLVKFETFLRESNATILEYSNIGISREEIEKNIPSELSKLPEDFYTLYSWRNGIGLKKDSTLGQTWLFPLGRMFSIQEANSYHAKFAEKLPYWDIYLFPVFESGGGEIFLLNTKYGSKTYGRIFRHYLGAHDSPILKPAFDSIQNLFSMIYFCFQEGIYYYDENNELTTSDYKKEIPIIEKFNPLSR